MEIRQAMGTPRAVAGRDAAPRYLQAFVEEMKASGLRGRGAQAQQPAGRGSRAAGH